MLFSVLVNDGLCDTTCGCRQNDVFDIIMIGKLDLSMGSILTVVNCSLWHVKQPQSDISFNEFRIYCILLKSN